MLFLNNDPMDDHENRGLSVTPLIIKKDDKARAVPVRGSFNLLISIEKLI
jgi:hypothetical protein